MIDKSLRTALLFLVFLPGTGHLLAQTCDNRCLSFDGTDDVIKLEASPITTQNDFTAEAWVYSSVDGTPLGTCDLNLKTLFYLGDYGTNKLELGECDGILHLDWSPSGPADPLEAAPVDIRDAWHHVALVRDGDTARVFLDFEEVFSTAIGTTSSYTAFLVGHGDDPEVSTPGEDWQGEVDEVRVWDSAKGEADLERYKRCALSGTLPSDLLVYWPMNQGVPGGNNLSETEVEDATGNGHHGQLDAPPTENFLLSGPVSNFVCSDLPSGMEFHISQLYLPGSPLEGICSGSPANFCVSENGMPLSSSQGFSVEWEYFDGAEWQSLADDPDFTGFCFSVPPGNLHLTADCSDPTGLEEKTFRPVFTVEDSGTICTWTTEEQAIDICCPPGAVSLQINTEPPLTGPVCEGAELTLEAVLTLDSNATDVEIRWTLNGVHLEDFDNQSSINPLVVAGSDDICLEAIVSRCSCPVVSASECIEVDALPVCGQIESKTDTLILIPDEASSGLFHICPGNDAVLGMVDEAAFENCVPHWQYMFPSEGEWKDIGSTNGNQYTNILPALAPPVSPYEWPADETCIVYRIECRPMADSTGCEACHTNEITICLLAPPDPDVITGDSPICSGEQASLSIANPAQDLTYEWFYNGMEALPEGPEHEASEAGCYWALISNGCPALAVETPPFCLEVCEIEPIISCPLQPNPCPAVGDPVTLSGCDSADNCSGILEFSWEDGDGNSLGTACSLTHTPDAAGTKYVLTVTNPTTGCSATTSLLIVPCLGN